jgi:hypothetical protein
MSSNRVDFSLSREHQTRLERLAMDKLSSLYCSLPPSFSPSFYTHSLSLSLTGQQGAHTLFTGQRERERKREVKRDGERGRERKKEREREGKERELLFKFLKGMTSALVPFSYLVC